MIRTQGFFVAPTSQAEIPSSSGQGLRATWDGTTGPIRWLRDIDEINQAWQGERARAPYAKPSFLSAENASAWMQQRGLAEHFTFDRPYAQGELEILERRKRAELRRASILSRADGGGAGRFGLSLVASMVDPVNLASAFVPVVGQARYANMMRAAVGAGGRAVVRGQIGAVEGLAGAALLEPLNYAARAQEQADWRAADSMTNVLFGGVFGSTVHVGGGALGDLLVRRRGLALQSDEPETLPLQGAHSGNLEPVRVGETYAPAQWTVMDAAELAPTLDKADNQYRDRNRVAAQAQVREIAANLDFNLLGASPLMDYGAPTLAKDLSVIGGNGRLAAIRMAYDSGRGDLYREALIDSARKFGISSDALQGMEKPVLVRVLQQDVDVRKAAMASNEGGAMRMSALEQAKVDAERLGNLATFETNEDGNLSYARSRDGIRKWVDEQPATQRAALLSSDGMLSAEGAKRLQNAMLFRAYGDSPTLARLVEATDPGSRNVAAAMVRAAPRMAEMRAAVAAEERFNLDISEDLQAAVEHLARIREKGQDVTEALAQGDFLGDGLSPIGRQLVAFMGAHIRSSRAMADLLARYMDGVDALGSPKQAGLFGDVIPPSREDLLAQAITDYVPSAAELVESAPLEVQRAAMQAAVVQVAQGQAINVEPIIKQDMQGVLDAARHADAPETKPLNDWQAAQSADEAMADIAQGDEAAQLAAAEKEIAEAEEQLGAMVDEAASAEPVETQQADAKPEDAPNFGLPDPPRTLEDGHPLLRGHALDNSPARLALRDHIVARHFDGATEVTSRKPIAYVMGGGGASGKGTIKAALRKRGEIPERGAVDIDPDTIKEMLPEYAQIIAAKDSRAAAVTHEESSAIAKRIAAEARDRKADIVLDRTMSDATRAIAEIAALKSAGYEVRLYGITIAPDEALKRAVQRAQKKNRWVPMDALLKAHKGFNSLFEKLSESVDRAVLFDNSGSAPVHVASRKAGGAMEVIDQAAYNESRKRSQINEQATTLRELAEAGAGKAVESAGRTDQRGVQGSASQGGKAKAAGSGGLSGKRLEAVREQLPDDLRAEAEAADNSVANAERMAEIARRASLCAMRKGA